MGVGQGQVEHVGVEIASAGGTAMLRIGHLKFSRPAGHRIAQIVQRPTGRPKPIRPASAPGTGASRVIPRPSNDLGRGKVFDASHAFGGVGNIASRAIHDRASVKSFSRRYRPTPGPKARKSSVTVLQSPHLRPILRPCQYALQTGGFGLPRGGAQWQHHLLGACA